MSAQVTVSTATVAIETTAAAIAMSTAILEKIAVPTAMPATAITEITAAATAMSQTAASGLP